MLIKSKPEESKHLFNTAQDDAAARWKFYQFMQTRDLKTDAINGLTANPTIDKNI